MMPEMESAFKGGRFEYVSQMAHNLAGSGGTMELPFITKAGRKLSELIHQRQLGKATSLIRSIHSFFISEANKKSSETTINFVQDKSKDKNEKNSDR
jgi:hypothetical protein